MAVFDPFADVEAVRREIDRAFAEAGLSPRGGTRLAFLPGRAARQYPLVNLYDDGDNFLVEALAPGVDPANLDVTVVSNTLTIAGQKGGTGQIPPERLHRSERAAGRFVRTVNLPAEVDRERVSAQYRNGLLLLTLPRAESARPRKVAVQTS